MKTMYIFYRTEPFDSFDNPGQLNTSVVLAEDLDDAINICKDGAMGFNPEAYIEMEIQALKNTIASLEGTLVIGTKIANNDNIKEI